MFKIIAIMTYIIMPAAAANAAKINPNRYIHGFVFVNLPNRLHTFKIILFVILFNIKVYEYLLSQIHPHKIGEIHHNTSKF